MYLNKPQLCEENIAKEDARVKAKSDEKEKAQETILEIETVTTNRQKDVQEKKQALKSAK